MTAFRDSLTPKRTPAEHFAIADRLVGELDELHVHELQLPYAKAKLALADIHARLAGCVVPDVVEHEHPSGIGGNCAHCGLFIIYTRGFWHHRDSGRAECFCDPQRAETATPETATTTAERI